MSKKKLSKEQRLEKRRKNRERRIRNEEMRRKRSTAKHKKMPGIVIPKQYLAQKNEKKKPTENKENQKKTVRKKVTESAAANAFMVSVPRGMSNRQKKVTSQKTGENHKHIGSDGDKDYYDFAGEYEARNVEYGHGRKRNREWNDKTALNLKKELDEIRKMREEGFID